MSFVNPQHMPVAGLACDIPPLAPNLSYALIPSTGDMMSHNREEGAQHKEFQCPVCLKYFSRKFTLEMHLLIHKGIKPHQCPFCGKCFRQKGTLMRHKALHSSTALFHCQLCNKNYRQKNVFLHHLRHRHMVRTDNLDRRKCATQLADADSLAEELPPFAVADKTALNASDKKLEAMLFSSLKTVGSSSNGASNDDNIANQTPQSVIFRMDDHQQDFLNALAFGTSNSNSNGIVYLSNSKNYSGITQSPDRNGSASKDVIIKWECNVCSYKCLWDSPESEAHLKIHKAKYPYECVSCKMLFSSVCSYRDHIIYHQHVLSFSKPNGGGSSGINTENHSQTDSDLGGCHLEGFSQTLSHLHANMSEAAVNGKRDANGTPEKLDSRKDHPSEFDFNCIPCKMTFRTEEDLDCHVKTHVQTYLVCDSSDSENFLDQADSASSKGSLSSGSEKDVMPHVNGGTVVTNGDSHNGLNGKTLPLRNSVTKTLKPVSVNDDCVEQHFGDTNGNILSNDAQESEVYSSFHLQKQNGSCVSESVPYNATRKNMDESGTGGQEKRDPSQDNHKQKVENSCLKRKKLRKRLIPVYCCPFCEQIFPNCPRLREHVMAHIEVMSRLFHHPGENIPTEMNCYSKTPLENDDSAVTHDIVSLRNLKLLLAAEKNLNSQVCNPSNIEIQDGELIAAKLKTKNSPTSNEFQKKENQKHPVTRNQKSKLLAKTKHEKLPMEKSKSDHRYFCYKCNKAFNRKTLFRYHNQLHLKLPKLKCSFCHQNFHRKDRLLQHSRLNHIGSYECSYCQKKFQYRTIFTHHEEKCHDKIGPPAKLSMSESPLCVPIVRIRDVSQDDDTVLGIIPVGSIDEKFADLQLTKYGIPVISPHKLSDGKQRSVPVIGKIILSDLVPNLR